MPVDIILTGDAQAVDPLAIVLTGDAIAQDPPAVVLVGDAVASDFPLVNLHGDAEAVDGIFLELSGDAQAVDPIGIDLTGDAEAVNEVVLDGDAEAINGIELEGDAVAITATFTRSITLTGNAIAVAAVTPSPLAGSGSVEPSPCTTCLPLDCTTNDDLLDHYSLQSDPFSFVLVCPPGYSCSTGPPPAASAGGQPLTISIVCCEQIISTTIQPGATQAAYNASLQELLYRCQTMESFCGGQDGPAGPPTTLYWNVPARCTKTCPDGTPFTYYVKAGIVLGRTLMQANAAAAAIACRDADLHLICLSQPPDCCKDVEYSGRIRASGGFFAEFPQTDYWSIISGSLPTGLTFHGGAITWPGKTGSQSWVTIDGTPTVSGTLTFTVRVVCPNGDYQDKAITIIVAALGPTSLRDANIGDAYSQNLTLDPAHDQDTELWSLISGSLPPGLELTDAGIIHGTPTGPLAGYMFGVQASAVFPPANRRVQCEKVFTITTVQFVNITPDIFSSTVSYWNNGDPIAAGTYRVNYINGAMGYGANPLRSVNLLTKGFHVVYDSGASDVLFPGTNTAFANQALCEAANAGKYIDIVHGGGTIGMYLDDTPYGDNQNGAPNPTFGLA